MCPIDSPSRLNEAARLRATRQTSSRLPVRNCHSRRSAVNCGVHQPGAAAHPETMSEGVQAGGIVLWGDRVVLRLAAKDAWVLPKGHVEEG